jgi:hypothetical protein
MMGGVAFPDPIPLDLIEREGHRMGYRRDDLEDFVEIVRAIDGLYLKIEHERIGADLRRRASNAAAKRGR